MKQTAACGDYKLILKFWGHVKGLLLRQFCWSQGSWERGPCVKHSYGWAIWPRLTIQICRKMNEQRWTWKIHCACKALLSSQHKPRLAPQEERLISNRLFMCSLRKWEFSMRFSDKLFICIVINRESKFWKKYLQRESNSCKTKDNPFKLPKIWIMAPYFLHRGLISLELNNLWPSVPNKE